MDLHTTKPRRIVSIFDPAIDRDKMDQRTITRYMAHRDESLVQWVPGIRPTPAMVIPASTSVMASWIQPALRSGIANGTSPPPEACVRAFQVCCVRVENVTLHDGRTVPSIEPERREVAGRLMTTWTDEALDQLPYWLVEDIGSVAVSMSFFGQRTDAGWLPPPSYRLGLTGLSLRHAEESPPGTSTRSNGKQSGQPQQSSDGSAAEHGGVTAEETDSPPAPESPTQEA